MHQEPLKISILGFGNVGQSIVCALLRQREALEINIIDPSEEIHGSLLDLGHAAMLRKHVSFTVNDRSRFLQADFIFHCAGASIPMGHSREYAMHENTGITRELFRNYDPVSNPRIIVISNPVDVLSLCTWKVSGLPKENVVGVGTMIDSIRLAYYLKSALGNDAEEVQAMVIGEHGDAMVPVLSHTYVNGLPVLERLPRPVVDDCIFECRHAAQRIKKTQDASYHAAAHCAVEIMNQFLRPADICYPISMHHADSDGKDLFYSMPAKFTKRGLFPVLDFELTNEEQIGLQWSIRKIRYNGSLCFSELEENQEIL